jgi:hypothetical protein
MTQPSQPTWPSTMILVHGYADSRLPVGELALAAKGLKDNQWYWTGKYSDNIESFNVQFTLQQAAQAAGVQMQVVYANWDGRSTVQDAVASLSPQDTGLYSLIDLLEEYATGDGTVDLVGHSTGDALIGYVLDQYADNPNRWNIGTVFIAGGAGGGTELASYALKNGNPDPVIAQLVPATMRALYNHDMRGQFAAVPNVRFCGAGTDTDLAHQSISAITGEIVNNIPYGSSAKLCRGQSDGLVPFHSQGGVSQLVGSEFNQAYDAYCVHKHTGLFSCGQLNLGSGPATRWTYTAYVDVPLFDGYQVQMIDDAYLFNHSDEVGRMAEWIVRYKSDQTPWYSSTAVNPVMSLGIAAATVPGTDILQLFYRGTDAGVYTRWREADGTWSAEQGLGGLLTSIITAAVVPGTDILQLFYRGTDGGVYTRWRETDGTWSDEQSLGGNISSNITAAVIPGSEILQLFYRGATGSVYSRWRKGTGTWSAEQALGGNITSDIAAATVPGTLALQLFYRGTDLGVYSRWRNPQTILPWSSEQSLGGVLTSDITAVTVPGTEVLQLFYQGTDGAVWTQWREADGTWSSEQTLGGFLTSDITAAPVPGTEVLQLFYRGEDGGVYTRWREKDGTWSDEDSLGGTIG